MNITATSVLKEHPYPAVSREVKLTKSAGKKSRENPGIYIKNFMKKAQAANDEIQQK